MILEIFTDGSLIKKNGTINTGYGIYFPNSEYNNVSNKLDVHDIHYAEIYAIKHTLNIIHKDIDIYTSVNIYTDSHHCIKKINKWYNHYLNNDIDSIITKKGRDIKNKSILLDIYNIMGKNKDKYNFIHIKSHSGNIDQYSLNNRKADKLARLGTCKK